MFLNILMLCVEKNVYITVSRISEIKYFQVIVFVIDTKMQLSHYYDNNNNRPTRT